MKWIIDILKCTAFGRLKCDKRLKQMDTKTAEMPHDTLLLIARNDKSVRWPGSDVVPISKSAINSRHEAQQRRFRSAFPKAVGAWVYFAVFRGMVVRGFRCWIFFSVAVRFVRRKVAPSRIQEPISIQLASPLLFWSYACSVFCSRLFWAAAERWRRLY